MKSQLASSAGDRGQGRAADRRPNELGSINFLTVAEVAERLGVCTRTVRRWIERGELVAHRFGTAVRIAESDLRAFIARQRGL